jgi:hypothetical protein
VIAGRVKDQEVFGIAGSSMKSLYGRSSLRKGLLAIFYEMTLCFPPTGRSPTFGQGRFLVCRKQDQPIESLPFLPLNKEEDAA